MRDARGDWAATRSVLGILKKAGGAVAAARGRINREREGVFPSSAVAWSTAFAAAAVIAVMLFAPPFLGMADDGSFSRVANPAGIYHLDDSSSNLYFNYYDRDYLELAPSGFYPSSLSLFVFAARALDSAFTRDSLFDLRFLGAIYLCLFVPVLALLIRQATKRVKNLSERAVIGLLGLLIFADVSYAAYFCSFYAEPLMYICFLSSVGAVLALDGEKKSGFYLGLFTVSGILLATSKNQCAVVGAVAGIFCVRFAFLKKRLFWRFGCGCCAFLLFLSMMYSAYIVPSDFTTASKYDAMTRGVLLEASDPGKALSEFGIDGSYAVLTDTSASDPYETVSPSDKDLQKGFYDKYSPATVAFYYLRHGKALLAMLDISVRSALDVRRAGYGNFPADAGRPKTAQSHFFSFWSFFKSASVPRTIGFVLLLLVAVLVLFRRPRMGVGEKQVTGVTLPLEAMIYVLAVGLSQAFITIINSGDGEMPQHLFLFSVSIDLLIYFCIARALSKLNVF